MLSLFNLFFLKQLVILDSIPLILSTSSFICDFVWENSMTLLVRDFILYLLCIALCIWQILIQNRFYTDYIIQCCNTNIAVTYFHQQLLVLYISCNTNITVTTLHITETPTIEALNIS
jgi:hypothetical protein